MGPAKSAIVLVLVVVMTLVVAITAWGGQVWTKCHLTCRCLHDNSVGNFEFVIPVDASPDIGFDADWACTTHGHRVCADSCNGTKFAYTYQVTSP
jgi:hypothetical protein